MPLFLKVLDHYTQLYKICQIIVSLRLMSATDINSRE